MRIDDKVVWLFRVNAMINWALSLRGIIDPQGIAELFGGPVPNYPFIVRLWSAFVFMFGCMFWEVSCDVRRKVALAKYNWIEKTITALAVTFGYLEGTAPPRLMFLIFLTNWLWIPVLVYFGVALQRSEGTVAAAA